MRQIVFHWLITVLVLSTALTVLAQDSSGIRLVGRVLEGENSITHVRLMGEHAYVGSRHDGFTILDISNPLSPQVVRRDGSNSYSVAIDGDHAFLVGHSSGLSVVNISDLGRPLRVTGRFPMGEYCWEVEVKDGLAYMTGPEGIYVIDVSNVDSLQFPNDTLRQVGLFRTHNNADGLAIHDTLAYYNDYGEFGGYFGIVDISDPAHPRALSEVPTDGGNGVAYSQGYAYSSERSDLRVFDVTDPESPLLKARIESIPNPWAVIISGNHLFVTSGYYGCGFWIFDISDPENLHEVGYYTTGQNYVMGIAVRGNIAYVAEWNCLSIYDCSEAMSAPSDPTISIPSSFSLYPAFPNPFNSATTIRFGLDKSAPTRLAVYDLAGRKVAVLFEGDPPFDSPPASMGGKHSVVFDASTLPSGVYLLRLDSDSNHAVRKLVLMR